MNVITSITKRIKEFVHQHEYLEGILLTLWGVRWIIRAHRIFRNRTYPTSYRKYKVIILTLRSLPTTNLVYFDTVFAHTFRTLGAEVKLLFHDEALSSTDAETVFRTEAPQQFVARILGKYLKRALHVDTLSYHDFITPDERQTIERTVTELPASELEAYQYCGVPVGLHAKVSAIRYFLGGNVYTNNAEHVRIWKKKLVVAMITAQVAERVIEHEQPQALFSLHGIYSTWGPFRDYCMSHDVDTVIYTNMPARFGSFMFNRNSDPNEIVSLKEWNEFQKIPLTIEAQAQIDDYFSKRVRGLRDDQTLYVKNYQSGVEKERMIQEILRTPYQRRFVMYPNLAWDALIEGSISSAFEDVFDWMDKTIEFFKDHPSHQLIVKPHPAELVWETCTQGMRQYIIDQHSPLPENITILEANTPINAYDLPALNAIGIVYNGTLGAELAPLGMPVIVGAEIIHYNQAGAVYPIRSVEEYRRCLYDPRDLLEYTKTNQQRAKKYAFFYFFKSMVRIPFYRNDVWSTIDWDVVRDPTLYTNNSQIGKICERMLNRQDICEPL